MAVIVTGDRYLESLVKFVEENVSPLIEGSLILKLNPIGLHYVQSRLEALNELERLISGAPVDYLRAYISDLGDHRALEQVRRILCRLTSLKVVSVLPSPARDPTPLSLLPFTRLKVLELRGCDLSTSAAKGLLELRHSLEKLVCHNSTDALRHVFASRIADIKDSPQWSRLSFVSCACNRLILTDESLQLLPAVETLDLSRNKFAKVDNLRKCTKLTHLDVGFNHLRSVASFCEITCHILKLVIRNNALTTLRGIENLKSLEGLDICYNIISNFSELEVLSSLPSLNSLWLEGNPLCCARWYRPQVFSFFNYPDKLKLDEKEMSTREYWKRQIIIARRHKRPASYGFYSPAREDAEDERRANLKKRKFSRLACIESDEHTIFSEQDSVSCADNEIQLEDEDAASDDEAEVVDLMNRIELMKQQRSVFWLRDIKEWMDHGSKSLMDGTKYGGSILDSCKANYLENKTNQGQVGERSRDVSNAIQVSERDVGANILKSDSFTDFSSGFHGYQSFNNAAETSAKFLFGYRFDDYECSEINMDVKQDNNDLHKKTKYKSLPGSFFAPQDDTSLSITPLTVFNDIMESQSSSTCHGSPPHYQEDLLHRRHNLEEEFLQLSVESMSVASSDSDTSYSEGEMHEYFPHSCQVGPLAKEEPLERDMNGHTVFFPPMEIKDNGTEETPLISEDNEFSSELRTGSSNVVRMNDKRKLKRRVVALPEEYYVSAETELSWKSNGDVGFSEKSFPDERWHKCDHNDFSGKAYKEIATKALPHPDEDERVLSVNCSSLKGYDYIQYYFNTTLADSTVHETCKQYIICNCLIYQQTQYLEREVAVIVSSEQKFYVLLTDVLNDGSGKDASLIGSHETEDVNDVLVGLGLQAVRISVDDDAGYLFVTGSCAISIRLLFMLEIVDSHRSSSKCHMKSMEQFQMNLFDDNICGGSKGNIYQYAVVLFTNCDYEDQHWVLRSLFVTGVHLFVCMEDFSQVNSLSAHAASPPYFLLDSSCSIFDISTMAIDNGESGNVALTIKLGQAGSCLPAIGDIIKFNSALRSVKGAAKCRTWKLKWSSREGLFKFVAVLKAIHVGICVSG